MATAALGRIRSGGGAMIRSPRAGIIVGALLFSTGGVAIKAASLTGWQLASFRSGVAALFLAAVLPRTLAAISWRVMLVGTAYAATLVLFVLANRLTTGANAIYLQSTSPFFLVLLAPLLLNERPGRRDIAPLVCVVLGLVLVLAGADQPVATAPDPGLGNGLALVSGLTYALLLIGFRWLGRADGHPDAPVASVIAGNALACVATLTFALPVVDFSAADLGAVLFLGVVQIGVAYVLVTRGMREVPALDASLLLLVEPALNPIWTWALLGERPTALAVMGGVAIAVGTVVRAGFSARTVTPVT